MELSQYLDKPIMVKLNPKRLSFINYADYRIGCDTCANGHVFKFILNISSNTSDSFNLQELKIIPEKYYEYYDLPFFYVTRDKSIIAELQQIYIKIGFENYNTQERLCYNAERQIYEITNSCMTTAFDKEDDPDVLDSLDNVTESRLCPICYHWFKSISTFGDDKFIKRNPLHIFWYELFTYDRKRFIFESPVDYQYIIKKLYSVD